MSNEDMKIFPVENISWTDAHLFVRMLNAREKSAGWEYRLPTEAEWEYACRGAPQDNPLACGWDYYFAEPTNQLTREQANFGPWFDNRREGLGRPCKVGSYAANGLGLYDMHGNVWEWCTDELSADPKDASGTPRRVNRGGSWHPDFTRCWAAYRNVQAPSFRALDFGLRLARVPVGK